MRRECLIIPPLAQLHRSTAAGHHHNLPVTRHQQIFDRPVCFPGIINRKKRETRVLRLPVDERNRQAFFGQRGIRRVIFISHPHHQQSVYAGHVQRLRIAVVKHREPAAVLLRRIQNSFHQQFLIVSSPAGCDRINADRPRPRRRLRSRRGTQHFPADSGTAADESALRQQLQRLARGSPADLVFLGKPLFARHQFAGNQQTFPDPPVKLLINGPIGDFRHFKRSYTCLRDPVYNYTQSNRRCQ